LRIKEQETHLTLQEHDDDDDDKLLLAADSSQKLVVTWFVKNYLPLLKTNTETTLSQKKPVHITEQFCIINIHLNFSLPSIPRSSKYAYID